MKGSSRRGGSATANILMEIMAKKPKGGFDRIRVEVSYNKGHFGAPRGYSIVAFPAKKEEEGTTTIGLFTGASKFIEGATKLSTKRLLELSDRAVKGELNDTLDIVLAAVTQRSGLEPTEQRVYSHQPSA